MNIKKMTAAIFALIAVVLIIGAGTVFFIVSRDEIVSTDISEFKENNFGVTNVVYSTENGNPTELSADYNVFKLGDGHDGLYRINVALRQTESKYYDLENISFDIAFSEHDVIISRYCSSGNGVYYEPRTSYLGGGQQVICDFEGNCAYVDIIVQLSQPSEIPVNFTYDISGKGLNFLNSFPDQSCEINIPCNK